MGRHLEFTNPKVDEFGFEPFEPRRLDIKDFIGRTIVYVTERNVDRRRGYVFPRFAKIYGKRYSSIVISEDGDTLPIRDIIDCGIKPIQK